MDDDKSRRDKPEDQPREPGAEQRDCNEVRRNHRVVERGQKHARPAYAQEPPAATFKECSPATE